MSRFCSRTWLVGAVTCLLAATLLTLPTSARAADPDCAAFDQPVTQLTNPSTAANLLTTSSDEAAAAPRHGFSKSRGAVGTVADRKVAGLAPVWRLHRSGDFAWALDGSRADELVDSGYRKEFVAFYAASTSIDCLVPVYQLERNGVHRIAGADELSALIADGWGSSRIAFYASWTGQVVEEPTEPKPEAPTVDTKFTIAVIPDTQDESGATSTRFANRVSYLLENKQAFDLRYALQVGDLTNWGAVDPAQFSKMSSEIKPLEAQVPWAGAIGNHDSAAVCVGGSACPGASAAVGLRTTATYNAAFPTSRFPLLRGTFEPGKIDNSYQTFSAGGVDWLVLNLELWPRVAAVAWARSVVADHQNHNVIVQTHAYLDANGSIGQNQGGYGSTSPQYLYDNLIKQHQNIKLVVSGHVGSAAVRTDTGVNANKIVSLLQTFHSSTNPVRIIEIDTAAGTMTSEVYAPYTGTEYPQHATSISGLRFV